MNTIPAKQKLLKLIQSLFKRNSSTWRDFISSRWEICPSEWQQTPAAIYLKNDLDKVTAVTEDTNWEKEMQRIKGGDIEHAATVAYCIPHCDLLDGSIYKGAVRLPMTKQPPPFLSSKIEESFDAGVLAATFYGSFYFGHWLTDDLTLYLAAEPLGKPVKPTRKAYGHEPEYLSLFNIQYHNITRAHFDNLTILDDFGQNSYKLKRYQELRSRLQKKANPINADGRVLIRRGQQGAARVLTNAAEIERTLQDQGFKVVDPEQSTVSELLSVISGARLVVGVEGSHMCHCIYTMAQNGGLCLLQSPFRFNKCIEELYGLFRDGLWVRGRAGNGRRI
jgi:hypothetical protein